MTSIAPVNTKVPKAKVYPREIVQAFKELEAIQPQNPDANSRWHRAARGEPGA